MITLMFLLTATTTNLVVMTAFVLGVIIICSILCLFWSQQKKHRFIKKNLSLEYDTLYTSYLEMKKKCQEGREYQIPQAVSLAKLIEEADIDEEKPSKAYGLGFAIKALHNIQSKSTILLREIDKKLFVLAKAKALSDELPLAKSVLEEYESILKNSSLKFYEKNLDEELKDALKQYGFALKAHFDVRNKFIDAQSGLLYTRISANQIAVENTLKQIKKIQTKIELIKAKDSEKEHLAKNFETLIRKKAEYLLTFCDDISVNESLRNFSKNGIRRVLDRLAINGDGDNIFEDYNLYMHYMAELAEYAGPEKQVMKNNSLQDKDLVKEYASKLAEIKQNRVKTV